ncbi:MAG: ABC-type transporter MlaC component [Bacteroidia bacterium]|jgi:ABC-type transporter MlaC component
MKKWTLILGLTITLTSCDTLLQVLGTANEVLSETGGITEGEAAQGLKEALSNGVSNGTNFLGQTDGFLKNAAYKILMPKEIRDVEEKIRENFVANALAGKHLDNLVTAMNRGAENAMDEAKPIFVNAIKQMTIKDAINIVTGGDGAATDYLKSATSAQLQEKFLPVIKTSLDKINANDIWEPVTQGYNLVTQKNVTTDLNEYVTDNAMTALFSEIKNQEDKIRTNPIERTTEILKKVFSYADTNK